jgi:putative N6-adenine-specific DNA methylase
MESAAKRIRAIQRDHGHPLVLAGDRDEGVVKAARSNADRAGVLEIMDISACSISDQEWFTNKAKAPASFLIATNPPYGKRIVSSRQKRARRVEELLPLYQTLGNKIMDQTRTGNQVGAVVLASNVDLVRRMGVPNTHALFSTDHGGLPVAAMGANLLPDPHPPEVTLVPIAASTD